MKTGKLVLVSTSLLLLSGLFAVPARAERKAIVPAELAPKPGAPAPMFSPGILTDGTLYVAGELGTDLKTREVPESFEDEVRNALNTIGLILKEAGMGYDNVVSVTVYLSDFELFPRMNAVYGTYFKEPRPARATIGVAKLAVAKAHIEISVTARK